MQKTKIEYTDVTWNPITGCLNACPYCYARGIARRFGGYWSYDELRTRGGYGEIHEIEASMIRHTTGKNRCKPVHNVIAPYPYDFDPTFHRYRLEEPQKIKSPKTVFVGSMSDMFGKWIPDEWIKAVFDACAAAPQHRYLFLTKNPARYETLAGMNAPPNIWLGMTLTSGFTGNTKMRVPSNAKTFISIEPILDAFLGAGFKTDWVIIGAETGNRKGKIIPKRAWIEAILENCRATETPIFMKNNLADVWGESLIQEFPWEDKEAS